MAAEQTLCSKSAKQKLKFGGNENKELPKHHDVSNYMSCCSVKSSVCGLSSSESKKKLCPKLKNNNSSLSEKQEPTCCILKQRKSELPKKQIIKKEVENTPVVPPPPPSNGTEELSRAKKRRLRKKKVIAIYTSNRTQAPPRVNPVQPEPVVKPNPQLENKEIKVEAPKLVAKELRKRPEKTILESRKKKIITRSPPQDTQTRKVTSIEPESCCNKPSYDPPKVVEPSLPRFYFPHNNQSPSWNGRPSAGSNSVFYFGETKNELEGLSAFKSFTPLNNTYDLSKKDNVTSNFSSVKRTSEGISLNKFNQEGNVFVNPSGLFTVNQSRDKKESDCLDPSKTFIVNQNQIQNNIHDSKSNFINSNILTNTVNQVESQSVSFPVDGFKKNIMDSGDLAQQNKVEKSRVDVLAEREAKKAAKLAAKLAAKTKHKEKINETGADKTNVGKDNSSNNQLSMKRTAVIDGAVMKPRTAVTDTASMVRSNDCVDGEILPDKFRVGSAFAYPDIPQIVDKVKTLTLTKVDEKDKQDKIETLTDLSNSVSATVIQNTEITKEDKVIQIRKENAETGKSKAELRAERRDKQEAQRKAKAAAKLEEKKAPPVQEIKAKVEVEKKVVSSVTKSPQHKAKLFSHLFQAKKSNLTVYQKLNAGDIHPAIIRLGSQYASKVVCGSNARCIALLHALKQMICDYKTPTEKEFSRGLEAQLTPVTDYLNHCRPLSVSMTNALRHIKWHLTQLPNDVSDVQAQKKLCDIVDTYIREQIDVAGEAICNTVQKKIANGDVILTYGCSSLIYRILVESHRSGTKFRVVVVDAGPWLEGREMLRRLVDSGLQCSYVLISATSFIMREVSKVLLGAHALLANGYVMSRAGSSQVALLAHSFNVPVLVCCETHKFSERVQTDAFVHNELGDPEEFLPKEKWASCSNLTPLTLAYDVTPPELVTAVVTELAILPCTSVPVVLRIKPSESHM